MSRGFQEDRQVLNVIIEQEVEIVLRILLTPNDGTSFYFTELNINLITSL